MHNPSKSSGAANGEMFLVKIVARLTPWFAPFPSAYFVSRSSMEHLQIPLAVAIIIAAIVEFLGLTSVIANQIPTPVIAPKTSVSRMKKRDR